MSGNGPRFVWRESSVAFSGEQPVVDFYVFDSWQGYAVVRHESLRGAVRPWRIREARIRTCRFCTTLNWKAESLRAA